MRRQPASPTSTILLCILASALFLLVHIQPGGADPEAIRTALASTVPIPVAGSALPGGQDRPQINPDDYTSARVCGTCHTDIYNTWKNSLHAFSLTDPVFDTSFMLAIKEGGEEARRRCLRCHAPMTMFNGDYQLELGVTREGVSCDFCHTVTAVHLDRTARPFDTEPGTTKRGIIPQAESPAHDVAYSALHTTSEFCAGCHNYVTDGGVAIMSTYEEWREGPYAREGIQCQDCHMVLSAGRVVREEVQPGPTQFHLHSLIHDTDQIRGAVSVEIDTSAWMNGGLSVEVLVENTGSGHKVPTGIPTREVVLTVTADGQGGQVWTQERRFRKVVGDRNGLPLTTDHEALLHGTMVIADNRLAPGERRRERFTFEMPRAQSVKLTATASYRYTPSVIRIQPMSIELSKSERYVYRPPGLAERR